MGNDSDYRPIVLIVLFAVELNDVFAFVCGKLLGKRKLARHTSPNKTLEGAVGALVLTTTFVALVSRPLFVGTPMDSTVAVIGLGAIIAVGGQFGDLMLSSIKRDLGIKDTGATLPGHGGLLDRFDSLILVAPAVFHYVGYLVGFGITEQTRILTG
jgi:phosphatidate cytidylyltransferase